MPLLESVPSTRRMQKGRSPMKLQFKVRQYQADAVDAVVETFAERRRHQAAPRLAPTKDVKLSC